MKKIILSLSIVCLFAYISMAKYFQKTISKVTERMLLADNSFEGSYLSGSKKGGSYWDEVIIKKTNQLNKYRIEVRSKKIKEKMCCKFNKDGFLKNDTIFVQLTDWKRPVTMIITKNKNKLTIGAIEKEPDDRFALSWYCCGGGSLIGEYIRE